MVTVAVSHLASTPVRAGSAEAEAGGEKTAKYCAIAAHYNFVRLRLETFGALDRKPLAEWAELKGDETWPAPGRSRADERTPEIPLRIGFNASNESTQHE